MSDGRVECKLCLEVCPSRTHWYRHKYKFHSAPTPGGLFTCVKCNLFFKSRKGYTGHCITRHGSIEEAEREDEVESDEDVENMVVSDEKEPESPPRTAGRPKKRALAEELNEDYKKQREKEDKLVADIIAKVKRECEAQNQSMCRKGYTRRSTVMTTFRDYEKRKS